MGNQSTVDKINRLTYGLGSVLVDAMLGGPRGVSARAASGSVKLTEEQLATLEVADEMFTLLREHEGDQVARAWFTGVNPRHDISQITALRDGLFDAVRASARAIVDDTPSSAV